MAGRGRSAQALVGATGVTAALDMASWEHSWRGCGDKAYVWARCATVALCFGQTTLEEFPGEKRGREARKEVVGTNTVRVSLRQLR